MKAGIIGPASLLPTLGWVTPFSVVEHKPTGWRRRFIAWPKAKNIADEYEATVPLEHISRFLRAVRPQCASSLDLKASFYQVPLPLSARQFFRCFTADGTLVELCRLPMGYRASPEIMQILTPALAGDPSVVRQELAVPLSVQVDIWIDNIRFHVRRTT